MVTIAEREKKAEERAIVHFPKLPPDFAMGVEANPAVVSARRVNDEFSGAAWRERLTSNAGGLVPPCLVVEDPEQ